MPITYEPMQAFDDRVAQAYGASQARIQDRDFALKATGQAQDYALRSSALAQQDEHFNAEQANRATLQYAHMGHQEAMQQSSQAHQSDMQRQGADLQAELDATKLNQAENMRLQRLNRQISYVTAQIDSGQKTRADGNREIEDLTMQRDPLQAQHQRAQTLHTQLQNEGQITANARAVTMRVHDDAFQMQALPDATVRHYDDDGTLIAITHPNGQGAMHTVVVPRAHTAGGAEGGQMNAATWNRVQAGVERSVDSRMSARGFEIPANYPTSPGDTPEARRARWRADQVRQLVNDRVQRMGGGEAAPDTSHFDRTQEAITTNPAMHNPTGMAAISANSQARRLFTQYHGNVQSMPPADKAEYLRLNDIIERASASPRSRIEPLGENYPMVQ